MSDQADAAVEALERILQTYQGDPNDPVWQQAQQALSSMKPKEMFLNCPECGYLHVDEDEWATKPHNTHKCAKCKHEWKPHHYPTVGIGWPKMDADETMVFLQYAEKYLRQAKRHNPNLNPNQAHQIRKVLGDAWIASRDFWLNHLETATHKKGVAAKAAKVVQEQKEAAAVAAGPVPEPLPEIAQHLKEGKLDREDIVAMGLDPRSYGLPADDEEALELTEIAEQDVTPEDVGISFDSESAVDEDTGIAF